MESPHLYDSNAEYNKKMQGLKVKGNMFNDVGEYNDLNNCELANSEISLDLQNFIEDGQPNFPSEHNLIQELQGLTMDKPIPFGGQVNGCPRGMGAIPSSLGNPHSALNYNNSCSTLAYMPQPVHSGSQFDRQYPQERIPIPIKEEPHEGSHHESSPEYHPCARVGYNSFGGPNLPSPYPMTPTTLPGGLMDPMGSPVCSPDDSLKGGKGRCEGKTNDDYRRRRERNNIAVRKSREKAKARTRETEERVKLLNDDNKKLQDKCKHLIEKVALYHSVFNSMNLQCLPEPYRSDLRNQMEVLNNPHHHQQLLGV